MTSELMALRDADRPARAPRPGRARLGWALLLLGLAALVLVGWGAVSALSLARHATAASARVREVQSAVDQQDYSGAAAATRVAARDTAGAQHAASALPLRLAAHLPGRAGHLVGAVRTVVGATDLAVSSGALPLVQVASTASDPGAVLRADGSVDVGRLREDARRVRPAAAALDRAQREVDGVDPDALPSVLGRGVRSAQDGIGRLAERAHEADTALAVLPAALGADGPRSYLVAFQNTAELRPTGGIPGSWALVGVQDGRTTLTETGSNDDLEALTGPVRDLGPEYAALYPPRVVHFSQDVNLSPHFPDAGLLLSDLWVAQGRPAPDGVVAVDPSGLAPLLRGAGDIPVPGGPSVNADDVVDVLLRQAYVEFASDNGARKQYLSRVVGTVFSRALGGGALSAASVHGVLDAARAGHVVAWSPRADEQAALEAAGMSGSLPAPTADRIGVYLTNTSASKLDYWLSERVTTAGGCGTAPDTDPATVRVDLHNAAPASVPDYVANKDRALPRTTESVLVALYVPPQRGVAEVRVGGRPVPFSAGTERGWSLARLSVDVPRGASTTVDVTLSGASGPVRHVALQPMVRAPVHQSTRCPS